jgi:lipid-binding SYLF domain-containing protein
MCRRSLILLAVLTLCLGGPGWAARTEKDYTNTIEIFKSVSGVAPFFDSAYGYAVFPSIGKGGLGIGAAHGKGQVYRGDEVTGFSSLTDLSIGLQAGGQAYRQVVFFQDKRAYDEFTSGSFEFDAGAGAVAVTASADASAGTQGAGASASPGGATGAAAGHLYHKGLLVFTISTGGLMYEATIAGQRYSFKPAK